VNPLYRAGAPSLESISLPCHVRNDGERSSVPIRKASDGVYQHEVRETHPMSTAHPSLHDLARRLLAIEAASAQSSDAHVDEAVRVCEKLRAPLVKFAGLAGFSSLLSRALALAKAEVPALKTVRVRADGVLEGFDEVERTQSSEAPNKEAVVLVAQLLGLLVTFIGNPLTLRLVRDAWPDVSMDGLNGRSETKS
jgi:hypothetical protein